MAPATDSSAPTPTVFQVRTFMMPSCDVLSTTPWFSSLVGRRSSIQRGTHDQERTTRLFSCRDPSADLRWQSHQTCTFTSFEGGRYAGIHTVGREAVVSTSRSRTSYGAGIKNSVGFPVFISRR